MKRGTIHNWRKIVWLIYSRGESIECCHCTKDLRVNQFTLEHLLPRSKGGRYELDNLLPACGDCNSSRGNAEDLRPIYSEFIKHRTDMALCVGIIRQKVGRQGFLVFPGRPIKKQPVDTRPRVFNPVIPDLEIMKDQTLWTDPEKKFKPINKQAALIARKANPWHLPPEETPKPVIVKRKTPAEIIAEYEAKAKEAHRIAEEHRLAKAAKRAAKPKATPEMRTLTNRWLARQMRREAKRNGLPKPTKGQINAAIAKQPGTGMPLFSSPPPEPKPGKECARLLPSGHTRKRKRRKSLTIVHIPNKPMSQVA